MIAVMIAGSLLAAGANLWPAVAEASWETVEAGSPAQARWPQVSQEAERWEAPVGPVDPATRFDPPPLPWLPGHRGVDLVSPEGRDVVAVGSGTVVFAGNLAGRGVVSIDHPGGLRTTYEPLAPEVAPGDTVSAGQVIGRLSPGHPSCSAEDCLHLGLKRGPAYLDPLLLFGSGQVRLLPRPGAGTP